MSPGELWWVVEEKLPKPKQDSFDFELLATELSPVDEYFTACEND